MSERIPRWILRGGRLIDPSTRRDGLGTLVVEGDAIALVAEAGEDRAIEAASGDRELDLAGAWIVPGLVDLRCALRDPGFEHEEDLRSGLTAAAAGGYVAVCATPDTDPIADRAAVISELVTRAAQIPGARLWPVGAATEQLAGETLAPAGELAAAGCVALSQGEGPVPTARLMRRVLEYARGFDLPVMISAVEPTLGGLCDEGIWSVRLGLPGSPAVAEVIAIARDLALAELTGARLHLSRISTAAGLDLVRRAKERGVPVTCDVTAHHLHLTAAALAAYDTHAKVWPPLRSEADRDALREGLGTGLIDAIASDHQPHHAERKACAFDRAATGVSAIETTLPLVLDLVANGVIDAGRAVSLLALGPRAVLGRPSDGLLAAGQPADLTVIVPDHPWIPDATTLRSKSHATPWLGQPLRGRAALTLVGGRAVWGEREPFGERRPDGVVTR